jgi:thiosulfate/3-mercaptopyruvate sulfurtransferase
MNSSVVSTDWLANHLNDANTRIVDIRGYVKPASEPPPHYFNSREDYDEAHIPGAVFIDWVHEITDPADPRHAQVAPPERYAEAMRRNGINNETFVVAYDDGVGMFAARLWWTLNYYGHTQAAILEGGYGKWLREGRPTTAEVPAHSPGDFTPQVNSRVRRTADEVSAKLNQPGTLLIDVRSAGEYTGEYSRTSRFGHIPGAVNHSRSAFTNEDGTFKPVDEVRAGFVGTGATDDRDDIVVYCNAGVSASLTMLAMRLAGYNNVSMYDGSWKDWTSDNSRPVEK